LVAKIKIVLLLLTIVKQSGFAWGFYAHKLINKQAVFLLPNNSLFGFYKSNIDFITENAVNADKRRYAVEDEACKHYIDFEAYQDSSNTELPKYWDGAKKKYHADTLKKHGILPWQIYKVQGLLTKAMQQKDADKILRLSADLGHYVADAHVPLHTTKNYDGQLTNQKGVHALWETRVPELTSSNFDLMIGKAKYVKDVQVVAWKVVYASNQHVASVLQKEKEVSNSLPSDQKFSFEERNGVLTRMYSEAFTLKYSEQLEGQVESRLRDAIKTVADLWYTSWVDAGQPDLTSLAVSTEQDPNTPTEDIKNDRFLESRHNCSEHHKNHLEEFITSK
jgi:hypothetical protein